MISMAPPLNITKAARLMGLHVKTLQRWDRSGKLPAQRTATGRRYYTQEQVNTYLRAPRVETKRRVIIYCRVSSAAQRPDLENQIRVVSEFCAARGLSNAEVITEIGGGLNFKRPKFLALVDNIVHREVSHLVIAHKDRLARFGFDLLAHLCVTSETELLVLNQEHLSPEREMVEDVLAILHCFSARLYGLRNYRKSLAKALSEPVEINPA
jgi:putative resolvase